MRKPQVYDKVIVSQPVTGSFAQARIDALAKVGMAPKYVGRVKRCRTYVKGDTRTYTFTIIRP